jgi:predicted DNA-binding protein YlxM (UPF0122 family)
MNTITEEYHKVNSPDTSILSSFERNVFNLFHVDNMSVRSISMKFNTPLESTYSFLNNAIRKLVEHEQANRGDAEIREMKRKLKIAEAKKVAEAQGSNELLIMSEI